MRSFNDTRVCVYRAPNLIEGNLIKGLLESSGIDVEMRAGALSSAYHGVAELSDARIFVTPLYALKAKDIIREYETRAAQKKHWTCGHCGEANTAAFETCWQCQRASPNDQADTGQRRR